MKFADGIKAVKEERRSLTKRLRQIDSILESFSNLSAKRQKKRRAKRTVVVTPKPSAIAKLKPPRKPRVKKPTAAAKEPPTTMAERQAEAVGAA